MQAAAAARTGGMMAAGDTGLAAARPVATASPPGLIAVAMNALADTGDAHRYGSAAAGRDTALAGASGDAAFSAHPEARHAARVAEIIDRLVPAAAEAGTRPGIRLRQLNVLVPSMLTPGDVEHLRDIIRSFGLRPVFVPDALQPPYRDAEFGDTSIGGGPSVDAFATLGNAAATLVIGPSLRAAADLLATRTGVPTWRLDHLYGLAATDALIAALQRIAGEKVPDRLECERAALREAMLATADRFGALRVAVAADPDLLNGFGHYIAELTGVVVAAVAPGEGPALATVPAAQVTIGDFDTLMMLARRHAAALVIGMPAALPPRLSGVPLRQRGLALHADGRNSAIGYAGAHQMLHALAQLSLANDHRPAVMSINDEEPDDALTVT